MDKWNEGQNVFHGIHFMGKPGLDHDSKNNQIKPIPDAVYPQAVIASNSFI